MYARIAYILRITSLTFVKLFSKQEQSNYFLTNVIAFKCQQLHFCPCAKLEKLSTHIHSNVLQLSCYDTPRISDRLLTLWRHGILASFINLDRSTTIKGDCADDITAGCKITKEDDEENIKQTWSLVPRNGSLKLYFDFLTYFTMRGSGLLTG